MRAASVSPSTALLVAALAGGCASSPYESAGRTLATVGVVCRETAVGLLMGAGRGLVASLDSGCDGRKSCLPVMAIGVTVGGVVGAGQGFASGVTRAVDLWRAP